MGAAVLRFFTFLISAIIIGYVVYLIGAGIVSAQSAGAYQPIVIRDTWSVGAHQLDGMVMVDSPCEQLFVTTQQLSQTAFRLAFTTWADPAVPCPSVSTPRSFHAIVFAAAVGITFVATYNGEDLPIAVIPLPPTK